tara:strand:- start:529 stop:1848 length:1320 start_codon:yes stop_codon:yes gene_type:complete
MSSNKCIEVSGIGKTYHIYKQPQDRIWQSLWRGRRQFYRGKDALQGISFAVDRGETVGILGANGAGKSTLLSILSGTVAPTAGSYSIRGRLCTLLELGTGFDQEFTGIENIQLVGTIQGFSRQEIESRIAAIVDFADIGGAIEQPVKFYSSGMYVRLAFSLAVNLDPDVLIIDEALAVGDEAFQSKCYSHLRKLRTQGGAIVFVSHSSALVVELCDRAILLDEGEMLAIGEPNQVVAQYQKLIFAPAAKRRGLRDELLTGSSLRSEISEPTVDTGEATRNSRDFFEAELASDPTVAFEKRGATISNALITDVSGERVNLLKSREAYTYSYRVRFDQSLSRVRFGMMIKTVSGVDIGGRETGDDMIDVCEGDDYLVSFRFNCYLNPGVYFLNAGALGMVDGSEVFLDRRVDLIQFRVLPNTFHHTGSLDLVVDTSIEQHC